MLHLPALVTGKIIIALIGLVVVAQPIQLPPQKNYEEVVQMYYIKVLNSDNCVLESSKAKDYSNETVKAIFKEYAKPASIHIDIEDFETGQPVANYHWSDFANATKSKDATKTENTFTKTGEWSEYTVREGENGWIIEGSSRIQGNRTGYKVVVPFEKSLYKKGQGLAAEHNNLMTVAEYIQGAEYSLGKVLRKGHIVE